ncbi:HlyD family secretion protein [Ferrimonas balearica]|uniref:HlyD family secretion protein n=1 Tax=Ferrimonas balearica TaxID=44012 RepID=UPI001C9965C7|nr:biotin/lipoyl-binding protein [Ferrimonas balearica]MBY5993967.1 biotin/lipoyl-binding protein [Ferrimonas balearica]
MKEIMIPYALLIWLLVKLKVMPWNLKTQFWSTAIGVFILAMLFTGSRYWAYVDLTNSATVRAPQAILSPLVGQQVDEVFVTHNQKVQAGDLIYTLVDEETAAQVASLEAQIKATRRKIDALYTQKAQNKRDLARQEALEDFASEQSRDDLTTQVATLRAEIQSAEAQIASVQAERRRVEFLRDRQQVVAPFDGQLSVVNLAAGSRVGNMHLYDTSRKFLEVRVADQFYGHLVEGAFTEFYVDAYPGQIFRGRVHSIRPGTGEASLSPVAGDPMTRQFVGRGMNSVGRTVIIEFEEPEGLELPIGAVGSAWISGTKPHSALGFIDIIGAATVRLSALKAYFKAL